MLKDNFFDFWLRFVYPNKQELEENKTYIVLERIKKDINSYLGRKFEAFVMELLPEIGISYTKLGKWWHRDKEIDIIALNEPRKEIFFAECKWQEKVNAEKVCRELLDKSSYVQWYNDERKENFVIFAKSFSKRLKEFEDRKVFCFDLRDLERRIKSS